MKRSIVMALALVGCNGDRGTRPPPMSLETKPVTPAFDDSKFVIAKTFMSTGPLPARFGAPLPASVAETRATEMYPPESYIEAAIAADTNGMRERLLAAITLAASKGPIDEDLASWYSRKLGYTPAEPTCAWMASIVTGTAKKPIRDVIGKQLSRCHGAAVEEIMHRPETPDEVIVEWAFDAKYESKIAYHPRIASAALTVGRTSKNEFSVRQVGFVLAEMAGDEAVEAAKALAASIGDPKRRANATLGMLRSKSPIGRALGVAACKEMKRDPMCKDDDHGEVTAQKAPTVDELVGDSDPESVALLAKLPPADVIAAAKKCATGAEYGRDRCLARLVDYDRPAAIAIAKDLAAKPTTKRGESPRAARALLAFPEAGALDKELDRLGFTQLGAPMASDGLSVADALEARRRSSRFDTETGQFPNDHDGLLAKLARLASPVLDDVVFVEEPPPETQMDTGRYRLLAYAGNKSYRLSAENLGDWYDVQAVIGLLNAICVDRSSPIRFAVLPTGDQTAIVIAGPGAGILELAAKKLIEFADPDSARQDGKAFEDQVFDKLQNEGSGEVFRDVPLSKVGHGD